MERMDAFAGDKRRFLPNKTFADRLALTSGADQIELYYFGPGHTDGDAVVVFPGARLAYFGDLFPGKRVRLHSQGRSWMSWAEFQEYAAFTREVNSSSGK